MSLGRPIKSFMHSFSIELIFSFCMTFAANSGVVKQMIRLLTKLTISCSATSIDTPLSFYLRTVIFLLIDFLASLTISILFVDIIMPRYFVFQTFRMPLIVSGDCVVLLMNSVLRLLIFKHHSYSSFSSSLIMVSACTVEEVRIVRSSAYAIRSPLFNACSSNFDDLRAASRKTLNRSGERTLFWATPLLLVTVC